MFYSSEVKIFFGWFFLCVRAIVFYLRDVYVTWHPLQLHTFSLNRTLPRTAKREGALPGSARYRGSSGGMTTILTESFCVPGSLPWLTVAPQSARGGSSGSDVSAGKYGKNFSL